MPPKRRDSKGLTDNDNLFIAHYMENGRIGTQAYKSVHPKCNDRTAGQEAYEILKRPEIQAEIKEKEQEIFNSLGISTQKTIKLMASIAYMHDNVKGKKLETLLKSVGGHITSNLSNLAKAQKMYAPDVIVNFEGDEYTGPILLLPAKKHP